MKRLLPLLLIAACAQPAPAPDELAVFGAGPGPGWQLVVTDVPVELQRALGDEGPQVHRRAAFDAQRRDPGRDARQPAPQRGGLRHLGPRHGPTLQTLLAQP